MKIISGEEGTAVCDILANNLNRWTTHLRGNLVLNGVPIEPSKLTDRVAYVKTDHHFTPDMSVRQTMLFHAFLREPGSHSRARYSFNFSNNVYTIFGHKHFKFRSILKPTG